MKYQYYISFDDVTYTEVFPSVYPKLTTAKDGDHCFFRTKCSDLMISRKKNLSVYETLQSYFEDNTKFQTQLYYKIYKGDETGTLVFSGFSSINDGKLDKDLGRFEIEPRIDDAYQPFLDEENTDFEVMVDDCFLWTKEVCYFEKEHYGNFSNGSGLNGYDTFSGSDCIDYYSLSADNAGGDPNEHRAYIAMDRDSLIDDFVIIQVTAFAMGSGQQPFCEVRTSEGSAAISNTVQVTAAGKYVLRLTDNASNAVIVFYNWINVPVDWDTTFHIKYSQTTWQFNNSGLTLKEFITNFITDDDCMQLSYSGQVKSTFLWQDALPSDAPSSISSWITSHSAGNYASEVENANYLNNVLIVSKPKMYSGKSGGMTFSKFMDYLFTILRCNWYIDADGDFRIEHAKYFNKKRVDSTGIDLTSATYTPYKPLVDKRKFKLHKEQMFNREQVEWQVSSRNQTAPYMDFVGFDILYSKLETSANPKKWDLSEVCNDIRFMINYPDEAPDSGFILAECESFTHSAATFYEIVLGTGTYTGGTFLPNVSMSQGNLQPAFWTWDRYAGSGYINAGAVNFDATVGLIEQNKIRFPYTGTIDPYAKITTDKGGGAVISLERSLESDFVTVDLLHDAY